MTRVLLDLAFVAIVTIAIAIASIIITFLTTRP